MNNMKNILRDYIIGHASSDLGDKQPNFTKHLTSS